MSFNRVSDRLSLTWCFRDHFYVQNFTIIYIKMGYPRLEVVKQCELAPTLLTAMEGKPQPQQDRWGGRIHRYRGVSLLLCIWPVVIVLLNNFPHLHALFCLLAWCTCWSLLFTI